MDGDETRGLPPAPRSDARDQGDDKARLRPAAPLPDWPPRPQSAVPDVPATKPGDRPSAATPAKDDGPAARPETSEPRRPPTVRLPAVEPPPGAPAKAATPPTGPSIETSTTAETATAVSTPATGATAVSTAAGSAAAGAAVGGTTAANGSAAGTATGSPPGAVRRHRLRYPRALRRIPAPRSAARRVAAWSRRPTGRLVLPGLLLALLIAGTGAAGAYLVPATAKRAVAPAPSGSASASPSQATVPTAPATIGSGLGPTGAPLPQRPADTLKSWAAQLTARVEVPNVALEAYGYAELVLSRTTPACGLKWTTLAAIGEVESNHGSANNASLLADGRALPAILGPPLNGQGGTMEIRDTDGGLLDGDRAWDRAVGPMQFIPSTWEGHAVDADNDGMRDPSDIDDAALAAGNYLCRGGRNLNDVGDWWAAILTYNDVQPYAHAVYEAANKYGSRSRT